MFNSQRRESLLPFPTIPEETRSRYSIADLALRPFGLYESDLSVDFSCSLRPMLVTEVLACCTRDPGKENDASREDIDPAFFWSLTVGKRIECLLSLACSGESRDFSVTLACPTTSCRRELEIELIMDEIAGLQTQAYESGRISVSFQQRELLLRRPTGNDQLAWLSSRFHDQDEATFRMISTLLIENGSNGVTSFDQAALVEAAGRALEECDPLINFSMRVRCPDCEEESPVELDLESLALGRLRQAQSRLLGTVHRLAEHYHWNEQEIFAVPHWRRAYYVRVIEAGKN